MGDDADDPVVRVDDRQGDAVVTRDLVGDLFLILVYPHRERIALHDLFDPGRGRDEDQILQADRTDQLTVRIDHIGA